MKVISVILFSSFLMCILPEGLYSALYSVVALAVIASIVSQKTRFDSPKDPNSAFANIMTILLGSLILSLVPKGWDFLLFYVIIFVVTSAMMMSKSLIISDQPAIESRQSFDRAIDNVAEISRIPYPVPHTTNFVRHKIFVSFYHKDDEVYRKELEQRFEHLFLCKSVQLGSIKPDLSDNYIKRLIQEGYIDDTSIIIVLVGPHTYCRKHVDWEISAGLNIKVGRYASLMGILLPEFPLKQDGTYFLEALPARLADNVVTGYADVYSWSDIMSSDKYVLYAIETAFKKRERAKQLIDNRRKQLQENLCS